MPQIEVTCFARHNTQKGVTRSQDEWHAHHLTKVAKRDKLNGKFPLAINGVNTTVNATNSEQCLWELARRFAAQILADHPFGAAVVPVPNGSAVANIQSDFYTWDFARRIAARGAPLLNASPLLRWKTDQGQAHKGEKPREVWPHKQNLAPVARGEGRVVLFDDVVTSGSQLEACRQVLVEAGFTVLGSYCVIEILDKDCRGDGFGFRKINRNPLDIVGLFGLV